MCFFIPCRIQSLHDEDEVNELLDLEVQSEEVMREWTSLLGTHHTNSNSTNNNPNSGTINNNPTTESGFVDFPFIILHLNS